MNSVATDSHSPLNNLHAANGSLIICCKSVQKTLELRGHRFMDDFMLAAVQQLILGANFLRKHRLLIDVAGWRLLLPFLTCFIPCMDATFPSASVSLVGASGPFLSLLNEFLQILHPIFNEFMPPHGVQHRILPRGSPSGCTLTAWHLTNFVLCGRSLLAWSGCASSGGPPCSKWHERQMASGTPAVITDGLTSAHCPIATQHLICWISPGGLWMRSSF